MTIPCTKCQGEGSLYTSRYGGNDPDVWRTGECPSCKGSGDQKCDARGCRGLATCGTSDGEYLCREHMNEWLAGDES